MSRTKKRKPGQLRRETKKKQALEANKIDESLNKEEGETIILETTGKNEIECLEELYQSALGKLNEGDSTDATMLFRGVVHECDKMTRIRNGEVPKASEEELELLKKYAEECPNLPYSFYLCYGNALYHLSLLDTEDPKSFLDLALEHVERALELERNHNTLLARARIEFKLHELNPTADEEAQFKKSVDEIKKLIIDGDKEAISSLKEITQYSQAFVDGIEGQDEKKRWIEYNIENWNAILQGNSEDVEALIGLGNANLCVADDEIADDVEEMGEEKVRSVEKVLNEAVQYFSKALESTLALKQNPVHVHLLIGESHVHLGNIIDEVDEKESINHYKLAVEAFNAVQKIDKDALPEQFEAFLNEWKADFES